MKKVYIYLADGFEEIEAVTVIDVLRRAGIAAVTVSITGRKEVKGAHGIVVTADELFEKSDHNAADVLVLPGGMPGTKHLGEHEGLKKVLLEHAHKGKLIGAICAAPSVIGRLGLLDSRKAVCYPGFEDALKGAEVGMDMVVRDGGFITSRGPGTAIYFALKLVEVLVDEETVEELKEGMIVQG